MGELKDYVFYIITKEDERYHNSGYSYGIKRNKRELRHWYYLTLLRDIDPYFFENIHCSEDWAITAEELAQDGNILIVNTAVEVDEIDDRMYGVYLPGTLTDYQIGELKIYMDELESLNIDVDLQGQFRKEFLECRMMNGFDAHEFLKNYVRQQEVKGFQKVMQ